MTTGRILAGLAIACLTTPVLAGPCTDQIAAVAKQLESSPAAGAAVTGTVSGSVADTKADAKTSRDKTAATESAPSLNKDGKTGGVGGNDEVNAAAANRATSAADVRRQQEGKPTAAANPAEAGNADSGASRAKNLLAEARALDAKGDDSCKGKLAEAKDAGGLSQSYR
ncbi:hypothetical protein [Methylobacterium durans]|uniref:Exopolysaccharide production protein YjbE n=1 Tax=Methylobacterium durans TaxID=2202825 RepID=A0A2U8VZQ5_9HYPH|nr:hypothetical protein [Methylobacterium durans]AWN39294.1 hypothetical protein DK389_00395 [Methylobacterium durans]